MAPKDKAVELVWKYYHNIEHTISNEYASKDWEIAKQCALIAVDEILLTLNKDIRDLDVVGNVLLDLIEYWQDVKNRNRKIMTPKDKDNRIIE